MATSLTNKSRRTLSSRRRSITRGVFGALLAAVLTLTVCADGLAADRKWQNGVWRDSGDERTYVIVARTVRLHLEDVPRADKRALDAPDGSRVKFAVEGSRAFVRDRRNVEHELRVIRTVDLNYTATGGGHFIKTISADGLRVTLEDNSVWDLDPRSQFFTIEWQALEGITVRRSDSEQNFDYEIDNTDKDEGALARYTPP
jgi:hypothetical protein